MNFMTGDYQDHTCMARDAVADARREAAAASARLAEAAVRYADCRIAEMLAAAARNLGADDPRTEQQRSDLFADLLLGRLAFDDQGSDETDEFPHADEAGQAEDCSGWRWKTLTPTPANYSAPNCNPSTLTENPSVNRSIRHHGHHSPPLLHRSSSSDAASSASESWCP